jgi:hypothetical protein
MVDNLADFLCIPWDPSKVIIVALVSMNFTMGQENFTLDLKYMSARQASSIKVTTVADKNIMSFNPCPTRNHLSLG